MEGRKSDYLILLFQSPEVSHQVTISSDTDAAGFMAVGKLYV
jgi:hypothetical protein